MSTLVNGFRSASVSKLPDAERNSFTNPSGEHHYKSKIVSQKNIKKYLLMNGLRQKSQILNSLIR